MFALVCGFGIFCVTCERHKPRHDEIEMVINKTHSKIWKCPECPFGHEPNVKCGASVNSSVHIHCVECVEGHPFMIHMDMNRARIAISAWRMKKDLDHVQRKRIQQSA